MNKTMALGLILLLITLAACSSGLEAEGTPPVSDLVTALALPGTPGSSWSNGHLGSYTGPGVPNGHRAEVLGRTTTGQFPPDSYIPTNAGFAVNLGADHSPTRTRVTVSPNSSSNPINCTWQGGQNVYCAASVAMLPADTLFTVRVQECSRNFCISVFDWVTVTTAYFRTSRLTIGF